MATLFFVSHTHWDREWYEPFQSFRIRLVRCIDKLIDILEKDPEYKHFLLDGQTIVLEDYLEVRPDRQKTLRDLVSSGRVQIGPWFVLPDEFLVSGEALVRNLLRGRRIAEDFGGGMQVGYIPDPFGHISQMPQILRGFGIGSAVFRRGLADEPVELWWDAADGTRVLACYLRDSYDNAAWLLRDEVGFSEGLYKAAASLAPWSLTGNLLLMNGTDHMEPWEELTSLLSAARDGNGRPVNPQFADAEILHTSLPAFVERVEQAIARDKPSLPEVCGELRNPKRHHLLPGVTSSRMWIKQQNAQAQVLLEKWAEPATAFALFQDANAPRQASSDLQLLSLAWKYLLQNHPHDSICGCGVDQTHADMKSRFAWVEQIALSLVREKLVTVAGQIDTSASDGAIPVVVFNPEAGPRTDIVLAELEVWGNLVDPVLVDNDRKRVPFRILKRRMEEYYRAEITGATIEGLLGMVQAGRLMGMAIQDLSVSRDTNPAQIDVTLSILGDPNFEMLQDRLAQWKTLLEQNPDTLFDVRVHSPTQLTVEFLAANVPGYGYQTFDLVKGHTDARPPEPPGGFAIENEFFQVEASRADGTLTISDKRTGAIFSGANRFVDGGDRGDLYNYCPPEIDTLILKSTEPSEIQVVRTPTRQSLRIKHIYRLPARLVSDRSSRSTETVHENITTTVSLYPQVRRIDFETEVDNQALDHRLCVEFPTSIFTDHAHAEQAFDVVARSLEIPAHTEDWIEQPRPEAPMQTFVSISDGHVGLTLAARGLPEYQARRDADGVTLALTLLRCTGWLSRDDLSTRRDNAGPSLETPGAQEIGKHVFEYTLIPHAGDWRESLAEAHRFAAPMKAISASPLPVSIDRAVRVGQSGGKLPRAGSMIEVSPPEFVISAIKPAEKGDGLVVRGYSMGDQALDVRLRLWRPFPTTARVNLGEELVAPLGLEDGKTVHFQARPKEIVSLKFIA